LTGGRVDGRTVRILDATSAAQFADYLRAVADQVSRPSFPQTQRAMRDALDGLYPKRSCTVPVEHSHGVTDDGEPVDLTTVERHVVTGVSRVEQDTLRLLAVQRDVVAGIMLLFRGFQAWDPERKVESCPQCGNPFPRGSLRCDNLVPDGSGGRRRCESSANTRICKNPHCGIEVPPGKRFVDGRCARCAKTFQESGRERIVAGAIGLGSGLLVDGVFVGEDMDRLELSPAGGLRSGRTMTPEQRSVRARNAAAARWGNRNGQAVT
jgi:hypothetical protein